MVKINRASTPQPDEAEQFPPHKKGGMPAFEPTEEQRKVVQTMAGHGIPHLDIARVVINPRTGRGIDKKTLELAFRDQLDVGHVFANSAVVQSLHDQALAGNVTAAIWWTKARMGWKETVQQQFLDQDGNPIGPSLNLFGRPEREQPLEQPLAPEAGTRH